MNLLNVRLTPTSTKRERDFIEAALSEDPTSVEAWGRLAGVYASDYLNCWNGAGDAELQKARDALAKAETIDKNNPMALHAKGLIARADNDHVASRDAFRAAHNAPDGAGIHCAFAQEAAEEINIGNWNKAVQDLLDHAIGHGPNDPSLGVFYFIYARGYFFDQDYENAIVYLEQSIQARPNIWYNWLYLIAAYHIAGNTSKVIEKLKGFRDLNPKFQISDVAENEKRNKSNNAKVKAGRDLFRTKVTDAWNAHP